ncbi:phosphoinositide phospholipase C family, EF-hand domain pair [Artemisia annua]|uniref:Phosphoinositide phospholipase C family, EF-hand domain pair n=1 Tax=Artemisia annua TaxID=35608 RepID=A0A2U1KEH3_ARTAN|nr:phosphoinositide phospholipase C family, EF-hand domain pair [Artemisia annua]
MSKQTYRVCWCFRRQFKVGEGGPPTDIKELFVHYSENGVMTAEHLQRFMLEVQKEDEVTKEDAEAIIDATIKEFKHLPIFHRRVLHLDAFFRYLLSDSNPPLPFPPKLYTSCMFMFVGKKARPCFSRLKLDCFHVFFLFATSVNTSRPGKVMHNMDAPLAHYFVYTGHNSYLTGNQISSDCSVVPIIESLKRGMVTKIYGDVLYCSSSSDTMAEFPSPESLKKRIVVSTKPPKEYLDRTKSMIKDDSSVNMKISTWGEELSEHLEIPQSTDENDEDFQYEEDTLKPNLEPQYEQLIAIQSKKLKGGVKDWLHDDPTAVKRISLRETRLDKAIENHATDNDEDFQYEEDTLKPNLEPQYEQLIAIQSKKLKGGVKDWLHDDPTAAKRISLRETRLDKAIENHATDVIR